MKYIVDAGACNLTKSQENLLDNLDKLVFPFEGFSTLSEIKSRRQIDVHISTRGYIEKKADDCIKQLDAEITRMLKDIERNRLKLSDCEDIKSRVLKIKNRAKSEENPLLGCYYPYESSPEVYLFIDNIQDYVERWFSKTDRHPDNNRTVDNVCGFVYVHEMMHAYFDSINNEGFFPVDEIEEAFAEYGMLFFLKRYSVIYNDLYEEANDNVVNKERYGPSEYGFGKELLRHHSIQGIDWISKYAHISNWLSKSQSYALKRYSENVVKLHSEPYPGPAIQQCLADVEDVLKYNWQQPQHNVKNILNASSIANNKQQPSNQLHKIIQNCFNDFSNVAANRLLNPLVVPSSVPVLWFGDMEKYMHSKLRVVTVGNNPSAREFSPNRFPGASLTNINDYCNALNNYFNYQPLNWFKWNEQALNGLGVSYGGKMISGPVDNIALHIDFHTPVATVGRWSQIPASQRNSLSSLFNKYYHQMLDYLAPDVIIIGINEPSFRAAFPCFGKDNGIDIASPGSTGYIRLFPKRQYGKKYTVVWNKFRDTPFNGVGGYNAIKQIIAINKPLII